MSAPTSTRSYSARGRLSLLLFAMLLALLLRPASQALAQEATPFTVEDFNATPTAVIFGNELDETGALYHIVQPGESLDYIARINNIDTFTILSLNGLPGDVLLHPGDRLLIRLPVPPTPLPSMTAIPAEELAKTPSITPSPTITLAPLTERVMEHVTVPSLVIIGVLLLVIGGGFAVAVWAGRQKPY